MLKQSSENENKERNIRIAGGVGGATILGGIAGGVTHGSFVHQINSLENQNLKHALEAYRMKNWTGARSPETLFKDKIYEKAMWRKSDIYEKASDKLRNLHRPAVTGAILAAGLAGGVLGSGTGTENKYLSKSAEEYDRAQGAVRGAMIGAGTTGAAVGGMAHMLLSKQIGKADNESWRYAMRAFNQPKSLMYTPDDKKVLLEAANSYAKRAEGLRALYKPLVLGGAAYGVIVGGARGAVIGADNKYLSKVAENIQEKSVSDTLANRLTNPVAILSKLDQVGTPATKAGTIALGMYMHANKET